MPDVVTVAHPLVAHRLGVLRDAATPNATFRTALAEMAQLLVYEACRTLPTETVTVETPLASAPSTRLAASPVIVPVLRAGLGMLPPALDLLPDSQVGFIGLKRDEKTLRPDSYVEALPADLGGRAVLVLDPMLATGGSLVHTLELLTGANPGPIVVVCVLAAPEGLRRVDDGSYRDITVVVASVDSHLNDVGFIVPGLGDAGDRQFGAYE